MVLSTAILAHAPAAFLSLKPPLDSHHPKYKSRTKTQKNRQNRRFFCKRWSECGDSNPGPPAPKAGALPTAQHPDMKLWDCPGVFSQSWRATNCAIPGYFIFLHDTMRRKKKQVFRVCGRRCGQAQFYGNFSTREFPPQATVPRTFGISLSREWIGHLSSQITCAISCAAPECVGGDVTVTIIIYGLRDCKGMLPMVQWCQDQKRKGSLS